MKKNAIQFFFIASLLILSNTISAQAFQKGNINVDVGVGFGAYGTNQTQTTEISWLGFSISDTHDTTDGAASTAIPIGFEYGISDKIGIGADFTYNNYFINDSDRVHLNSVKAIDFGVKFNYHLLNADRNDLFIGLGIGFSSIKWDFNTDPLDPFDAKSASGSGVYWNIGLTDRIFFSDNVGILFHLGYKGYSYPSIEHELTSETQQALAAANATYSQKVKWQMNGVNIGTGLAIKF